ncbi:hypothetical protein WG902_03715 [Ramlibacter sp. PS3R-8]|uniref:hypothetical protein n=1 Tax=Ramlibacter sp. PS3R-8 TaxID=3133437 RepID=UPI00309BC3FD
MSKEIRTIALGAIAAAASWATIAQTAAPAPAAPQPQGAYSSAFEGYRPFAADEVGDWRKANETVREIGGWRAYAREIRGGPQGAAQQGGVAAPAAPAAPAPAAPAPAGPAAPHQGHTR